jgi:hypothetical protein
MAVCNAIEPLMKEGVTEYLTNIMIHGRPGEVSPELREGRDTGHYPIEREIVQVIANRVGLDIILNAYAEDYDSSKPNTMQHTRVFMRVVRKAYGPGFLQKLDKLDEQDGPERALAFVKAAEYVANNRDRRQKTGKKVGRILGVFKDQNGPT